MQAVHVATPRDWPLLTAESPYCELPRPPDPIRAELWRSGEELSYPADDLSSRTACLVRDSIGFGLPHGADHDRRFCVDRLQDITVDVSRSSLHDRRALPVVPLA